MTCPGTPIPPENPPPPARDPYAGPGARFFVTACLNCAHCRDGGHPDQPERWVCAAMAEILCHVLRNDPGFCALKARWFKDAIAGR